MGGIDTVLTAQVGRTQSVTRAGGDHAAPPTSSVSTHDEQVCALKKRKVQNPYSVSSEMLKTQKEILKDLRELVGTQQRSVLVQERLLALEECRVYGRVIGNLTE